MKRNNRQESNHCIPETMGRIPEPNGIILEAHCIIPEANGIILEASSHISKANGIIFEANGLKHTSPGQCPGTGNQNIQAACRAAA